MVLSGLFEYIIDSASHRIQINITVWETLKLVLSSALSLKITCCKQRRMFFVMSRFFFLCRTLVTRRKTYFSISLPSSKLTISLISFYEHDAIDIVDPSSMQDACHMNFVIDLAYREVSGSVVEHRNAESEGLRFDSSWGLRNFSLSHARDKTKNILLYFFTKLRTYHLSLFLSTESILLKYNVCPIKHLMACEIQLFSSQVGLIICSSL